MFITKLSLQNFRNFHNATFSFGSGINCILGPNGSGKSNLLEAIYFAATGRPSKAGRDGELISFGENVGRVEARAQKRVSEPILEAALERIESDSGFSARKTLKLNHQPIRRLSELLGEVKVVLFTPADHGLVGGEPSIRRRFLDLALSQVSATYLHHLQQYQMVKDQRNSLLKRLHSREELLPWNDQLVESGSRLLLKRLEILPRLSLLASEAHHLLSIGESLSLSYLATTPFTAEAVKKRSFSVLDLALGQKPDFQVIAEAFHKALERTSYEESQRGMTLVGPHRDDLGISLNGMDARLFASQGEQKTIAASLKMAEGGLYQELDGEPPVYLLDDSLSELDFQHQEALVKIFLEGAQSLLTMSVQPGFEVGGANLITLESGKPEPMLAEGSGGA